MLLYVSGGKKGACRTAGTTGSSRERLGLDLAELPTTAVTSAAVYLLVLHVIL